MPLPTRPHWLASALDDHRATRSAARAAESVPPSAHASQRAWSARISRWLGASAWVVGVSDPVPALGHRRRSAALASARLDFAEALFGVHTPAAALLLDRIAITRSLHELWHLRGEIFGHVSRRHGQAESEVRLASLDSHFPKRMRRAGFATRAPLVADEAFPTLRPHRRAANDAASG